MDKHEEESYSFYFLKSKHLQKKCPDDAKVDITPKDLIKMIKEKSFNLNPSNYDLIDIDLKLAEITINQLSSAYILIFLEYMLTAMALFSSKKRQILKWMKLLVDSKKSFFLKNENSFSNLDKLLKINNLDTSIIRKIHLFQGKHNLLIEKNQDDNIEIKKTDISQKKAESEPLLKIMIKKEIPNKKSKKIQKKPKKIKPKLKKNTLKSKKQEIQTSDSLSENSFNKFKAKPHKESILKEDKNVQENDSNSNEFFEF